MHHVSSLGHEHIAELLLNGGVAITARRVDGCTPLICAFKNGHKDVARLLLDHGADVTIPTVDGVTALSHNDEALSELFPSHEAIRMYLLQNPTIDYQDENGRTVLHRACFCGQESLVQLLLELGATDSEDNDDRLPLQDAVYNGNEAVIRMLLPRGNLNTKIKDGAYPIHWTSDKATSAQ